MSGSEPRLHHKERVEIRKLTGDRTIESAKDVDRWKKRTGLDLDSASRFRVKPPGPDVTETEAVAMVDEFREETYGRLPDGETIRELHGDRVLVEIVEERLSETLVIPDKAKNKSCRGVVRMTGPGRLSRDGSRVIPLEVKPGDFVILKDFSGIDVGEDKRLVEEDEILCVIG